MKQLITIIIILFVAVNFTRAQDKGKGSRNRSEFAFGLKGGLNLTNLKVRDPQGSYDSHTGYHVGLFMRGRFFNVGLQPELLLFTQSSTINYGAGAGGGSVSDHFTYLSTPIMLKFYPVGGLNFQLGPQFGFLLDGRRSPHTIAFNHPRNIKDAYKSSDISISVGGGWDMAIGLSLDVRYNLGLKDINNVSNGEETRSRIFLVSVGWNFLK